MKVLMISNDKSILDASSAVARRMVQYGAFTDRLDIIVFSRRGYSATRLSDTVTVYPTNSRSRLLYVYDAVRIGKQFADITAVTTQDFFEGLAGWRIARRTGAKLELQIHTDVMSPYFVRGSFLNRLRRLLARFLLPRADCVRVVSERVRRSITGMTGAPISVLPVFTDISAIQHAPVTMDLHKKYPQFGKIVLMVSRLEPEKNVALALAVFARAVSEDKPEDTALLIVGEGRERAALSARAREHGIAEKVFFEGFRKDAVAYYKTADVFLQTSNYEGYGLALLEAFASGLAVVTTDVGIAGDIVSGSHAGICPVGDSACLSKALYAALKNEKPSEKPLFPKEFLPSREEYLAGIKAGWERCGETT